MNMSAGSTGEKHRAIAILRLLFFLSGASSLIFKNHFHSPTYLHVWQHSLRGQHGAGELPWRTRAGLSAVLILVPSFLMGGTLLAIARFLAARRSDFQSELDRFYALNTLGAASGVLISTYALIPVFGIRGTIAIASSINILIAIASNIRALSQGVVFSKSEEQESRASLQQPTATMPRVVSGILLLSSFLP